MSKAVKQDIITMAEKQILAEDQIDEKRQEIDYDTRELWNPSEISNQTDYFRIPIGRYQTHKPENMKQRIDYVKDKLLSLCTIIQIPTFVGVFLYVLARA